MDYIHFLPYVDITFFEKVNVLMNHSDKDNVYVYVYVCVGIGDSKRLLNEYR